MNQTVLICDDESYILELVTYVVDDAGYPYLTAKDGETALKLARKNHPRLMILDVMLPGMTGFEVCRELKSDPQTRDIYIIILSARGQESDEMEGKLSGADEYMTKPFSPRRLKQRLDEMLQEDPANGES